MTDADDCRAIARGARTATLATLAARGPYASLVTIAWDARGRPVLLLSSLAEHTKNLAGDARASLLVTGAIDDADPLATPRMTLVGTIARVVDVEAEAARAAFVEAHPSAAAYATFRDFAVFRMEIEAIRLVAGFARQAWVAPEAFVTA